MDYPSNEDNTGGAGPQLLYHPTTGATGHPSAPTTAAALEAPGVQLGLGKINREPRTEPKKPRTETERTGTENFGSMFGS